MRPADKINELIRKLKLRASADLDKRVHDDISRALAESKKTESAFPEPNIWRTIMRTRTARLGMAAVIALAVIGGMTFWPGGGSDSGKWWLGPSTAWGQEVLAALDTIEAVTCREQTVLVRPDGSEHTSSTWNIFYVSHDSYRRDIYDGNSLREIQWYVPDGNDMIQHYVRFDLKCYGALTHRGHGETFGNQDPVERVRSYVRLDKADKLLGEKIVEDRNCAGFEISASKYGNRPQNWVDCIIWFDVETKLPVRIEERSRPVTNGPNRTVENIIMDRFNYNLELPDDTFVPKIPEGFIYGHPDDIQAARKKQ